MDKQQVWVAAWCAGFASNGTFTSADLVAEACVRRFNERFADEIADEIAARKRRDERLDSELEVLRNNLVLSCSPIMGDLQ